MKRIKIAYNKIKDKVVKKAKEIKNGHLIREYFKNNILFVTFVITGVLSSTILFYVSSVCIQLKTIYHLKLFLLI